MATLASDWLRHSRLLLWHRWMEFNKIHRKQDLNVFYHVCVFRVYRRNKIAAPACDWLRHFRFLLWNHWMEFNKIWQDARSQRPLISLCFSGRSEEKNGRPVSDLPRNFDFSSVTAEQDSTKLDRKQDLSVLYQLQFVLFGPIKKAALASDWMRHFRLLLCDRWTEFNETWQEAKFQRPLPSSCYSIDETWQEARYQCPIQSLFFWADEKNKKASPASDWLRHFRLLLWTEFNKTWQEIRYVNAIFQVCVFRADRKNIYSCVRYVALGPLVCVLSRNENI